MQNSQEATFFIFFSASSGSDNAQEMLSIIRTTFTKAHRKFVLNVVEKPSEILKIAEQTVEQAKQVDGIIVAAGGDGAINAVMQYAINSQCTVGLLPQGTFNLFARTHNIPETMTDALKVLLDGYSESVQVGFVNEKIFLANASLGLYPDMLEFRENVKQKLGRSRLTAFVAGFIALLQKHPEIRLKISTRKETTEVTTLTLFIGNNQMQLEQIGIHKARLVEEGHLAAIRLKPLPKLYMFKLMFKTLLHQLSTDDYVVDFYFKKMMIEDVRQRARKIKVAMDGEVLTLQLPLEIKVAEQTLQLIKPRTVINNEQMDRVAI